MPTYLGINQLVVTGVHLVGQHLMLTFGKPCDLCLEAEELPQEEIGRLMSNGSWSCASCPCLVSTYLEV